MFDFLAPIWNTFVFNPMVNLLLFIYVLIGNYGVAIILFTLLIRLLTLPFYAKQQNAMKKQQALTKSKEWQDMQKKYAKDRDKLAQEQMRLYREAGVNPLGGCLPALIPWPILIGLYQSITMVMGTQPEQLMDLSKHLYNFLPESLPRLAQAVPVNPFFLGLSLAATPDWNHPVTLIVPALVMGSTWLQQKMMPTPTDAQTAQMNQSMQLMMPVFIGYISLSFPIGLSLYWIVFNVVGIVQQYFQGGWGNLFKSTRLTPATAGPAKGKKNVENKS